MTKKILLFFLITFVFCSPLFAQELFLRTDKYTSELYLKLDTSTIKSIDKQKDGVTIYFKMDIRSPFSKTFDDRFFQSALAQGSAFTVKMKPGSNFTVVQDLAGIKIVSTREQTSGEIFSSYGIGKPLLSEQSNVAEDKQLEAMLDQADKFTKEKKFTQAVETLKKILATSKNEFYRQEALFRLGQTYMLVSQLNDQYLIDAYTTFDDFAKLYPDNFRTPEVMFRSAEAKEKANQLFEAIFTYQKILNTAQDLESKRLALTRLAGLYKLVGQLDKAIDMYRAYLKDFRTDADLVNSEIGQILYDQKELNMAYEYFSNIDVDKLVADNKSSSARLFAIAKTFQPKGRNSDVLKLYRAIYENFPDSKETSEAIFSSVDILEKSGRADDADRLLLRLKQLYPDKQTGQLATIDYAKKYLNSKPSSYWKEFFKDMLSRPDNFDLHSEAEYLILKSQYGEGMTQETLDAIDKYLSTYKASPSYNDVDRMRANILYKNASDAYKSGDYKRAEPMLASFIDQYPETTYKNEVETMLNNIRFAKSKALLDNNNFQGAINAAEDYIVEKPSADDMSRWFNLYDDALYKDAAAYYGAQDYPSALSKARQYLVFFPRGKYRVQASDMVEGALRTPMMAFDKAGDTQAVIKLYDENSDWLKTWFDKRFVDDISLIAALNIYKAGFSPKARAIYSSIAPIKSPSYTLLGLLLGDRGLRDSIDMLDTDNFKYLVSEVEQNDPDFALSLLKSYKKDVKLAGSLEYMLAKNVQSDATRQEILMDLYDTLRSSPANAFEGSEDVYLDVGLNYFKKNDFQGAVVPLKLFIDGHPERDEKRAEALYYLGKSFVNMNDKERGFGYYKEIINTMPDSIYAGIAKSELEDSNWRENLNKF